MLKNYVAVIQAGGKGTRMKSLTKDKIPKPLLKINGKPMIEWQIENIRKYGIQEVVLIIGHLGEKIKEYFQDGVGLGIHLTYIEEKQFQVEVLINNAGISIIGLLQDLTRESWNNIWNTNVTSAISLSQAVIPVFLKEGSGKIINISSVWGSCGASCETAYSATKGAVNTFTKALAKELAPSNIQVNAIACGIIDTKMNAHLTDEDVKQIVDEIPAGRLGTPADVAKTVCALLTASPYMTGQIITLDGGWTV